METTELQTNTSIAQFYPVIDDFRVDIGIYSGALLLNVISCCMHYGCHTRNKFNNFDRLVLGFNITNLLGNISFLSAMVYKFFINESEGYTEKDTPTICQGARISLSFVLVSTNFLILVMFMERFALVWFPLRYTDNKTNDKKVVIIVAVIWIVSVGMIIVPVSGYGQYVVQSIDNVCRHTSDDPAEIGKAYVFVFSFVLMFTLLVSIVLCALVLKRIFKKNRKCTENKRDGIGRGDKIVSTIYLMLLWMVAVTCGFPLMVATVIGKVREETTVYDFQYSIISKIAAFSIVANPIIYVIFRKENLQKVTHCCTNLKTSNKNIPLYP